MFVKQGELTYEERESISNMVDRLIIFKVIECLGVEIPANERFYISQNIEYMTFDDVVEPLELACELGKIGEISLLRNEDFAELSLKLNDLSKLLSMGLSMDLSSDLRERIETLEMCFENISEGEYIESDYENGELHIRVFHTITWHTFIERLVEYVLQARMLIRELEEIK